MAVIYSELTTKFQVTAPSRPSWPLQPPQGGGSKQSHEGPNTLFASLPLGRLEGP
jgi:hypothetical protein